MDILGTDSQMSDFMGRPLNVQRVERRQEPIETDRDATRIGHHVELREMEVEMDMAIEMMVDLSRKMEGQQGVEEIEHGVLHLRNGLRRMKKNQESLEECMKRVNIAPRDRMREIARLEEETSKYELLLMKLERKAKSAPVLLRDQRPHFPQKNIKLPKIELKKFGGNILKWTEFWQPFENSIHNNPAVSTSDKFAYLKGCLEGAPLRTTGALDLSAENYNAAVAILKERYGRNDVVQKTHLRALETLTAVQDGFDAKGLKTFYEEVEGHCTGLLATGMEEE